MNRKEQIEQAAIAAYGTADCRAAEHFVAGAEWSDGHPKWISVEDALPPNNGGFSDEVLAYDSMYCCCMITSYDYGLNLWLMCKRVTHWQYLPQPPKKGD